MKDNNIKLLSLGSDPEFFITDSNCNPVSSIGLVGGSKNNPKALTDGFFIQEDNVALEMNIPPSKTRQEFINNIKESIMLANGSLSGDLHVSRESGIDFPDSQLSGEGAMEFFCDPDYSPWLLAPNDDVKCMADGNFRSAGGHIHLGYTSDRGVDMNLTIAISKALDLFLGVPSVLIDLKGLRRREFYGKNGSFRMQDYGMEYRTLSNFWCFSSSLTGWVWDSVERAISHVNNFGENSLDDNASRILSVINDGVKTVANELMEEFGVEVPEHIMKEVKGVV